MRVAEIRTSIVTRRYDHGLRMHHQAWTEKHALLIFAIGDDGTIGVGETWCDTGDPRIVEAYVDRDIAPAIIGMDACRPEAAWAAMMRSRVMGQRGGALFAAVSGIDIAIWDLFARHLGVPLHQLLGGRATGVPIYASGGFYGPGYGPDDLARDMMVGIDQGCAGVKVKAAMASPAEEAERFAALRAAVGPDRWLMADFLFAPDVPTAIACARAIAPYDLRFLEAPTTLDNLPGWRRIRDATGLSLAGPEMASGAAAFRDAILIAGVDYLQLDVTVCGGLTEARRIAGLAALHNVPLSLHCSGSAIALAANAALGAALGADSIEYHLLHQTLFDWLWQAGFAITDGALTLPDRPGLGLALAPDNALGPQGEA